MEVVPAVDISGGKCVRLFKGQKGTEKVYYENPLDALTFWIEKGAKRIHFVDLDGAWGSGINKTLLDKMIERASDKMKVQIGGGIRSIEAAIELIKKGVDRVIIGTLAIKQPEVIKELAGMIGSEHLIVALDYRGGKIETNGWTKESDKSPFTYGKIVEDLGCGYILFSSIEADGAFTGPDFNNIEKMVNSVKIPIYAAGGIRDVEDLKRLNDTGVWGVIVGKAFYEEKIPYSIINEFS
jgi:phosphoribosylformimino-5-aminoimidazole carboxamide ribotide isomerase